MSKSGIPESPRGRPSYQGLMSSSSYTLRSPPIRPWAVAVMILVLLDRC
jgi:hypothetical protein